MSNTQDPDRQPPSPGAEKFRSRSIALAYLSMVASAGAVILVRPIQDYWGDPGHWLTSGKYLYFLISNLAAFIGAALILFKFKHGLWIYLAGQAMFILVVYGEMQTKTQNSWDDFVQIFNVIPIGAALLACILQPIFTLRSEL